MFMGQVVEGRTRTRRFQNRSTERNSEVKLYTVSPEEGQTCYQNFSIRTVEQVPCSMMSLILAAVPADVTGPWENI